MVRKLKILTVSHRKVLQSRTKTFEKKNVKKNKSLPPQKKKFRHFVMASLMSTELYCCPGWCKKVVS